MKDSKSEFRIGQHLAERLYAAAVVIGLLVSLGFPGIYFFLGLSSLRHTATIYAREIAARFQEILIESPDLWKYQAQKYNELLDHFLPYKVQDVIFIRIWDEEGRQVVGYEHKDGKAESWWSGYAAAGSAPLLFNNRKYGTLQVGLSQDTFLAITLVVFLISSAAGVSLAVFVYRFPVRVVTGMEGQIQDLVENLQRSNVELEDTNKKLQETQERVIRTERLAAIGELSAGIAHELRNPLGAIKNAAYYIKEKVRGSELVRDNPRIGEFLEIMNEEIETSNQIITDLMDFSRVNPPNVSPTRLETVIGEALSRTEVKGNVKVVKELEPGLPEVQVDPEKLRRAFGNLIKNADEAMPEGGTLAINARAADRSVEVQFRDTGHGISDANLPKVFDPLFTTKPRGIGLGTAIVKKIIESHKGTINVSSKSGEGTNFTVRLPINQE